MRQFVDAVDEAAHESKALAIVVEPEAGGALWCVIALERGPLLHAARSDQRRKLAGERLARSSPDERVEPDDK